MASNYPERRAASICTFQRELGGQAEMEARSSRFLLHVRFGRC